MKVLAVDPGPTRSAYVVLDDELPGGHPSPESFGKVPNEEMLELVQRWKGDVVIEWITVASVAGAEVYQTCRWIGRYEQASVGKAELFPRMDVLLHLFGRRNVPKADALVRRAMLDRYGGDGAKGTKKEPGPLYGFHTDCWQALGLGIAYWERGGGN
jgi:hypothetical protein